MKSNIDFEQTTLGEVCDKIGSGATPRGGDKVYISSGIAQIRSQNVLDYSFSKQGLVYIDDESATALNNVTVQSNDVLFNITGDSVARACIAPDWVLPARVNQHVAIIRANNKKADNRYLLYTLQYKKDILLALSSSGATRNAITKGMLSNLPLLLPPLPEQRAIAATLSCLDDKIELNNRMNKTLEEMAQAIFKSWFVDFEPFQDGEFVDSELGRIPKGWRVGTLSDIAYITMGQSPIGTSYNEDNIGTPFFQGRAEFGWRYPQQRLSTTEPKRMAMKGDILLSVRAPVGDVNIAKVDCCIGRGLAAIRSIECTSSFLFYTINSLKPAFAVHNGEGTVFGSINKDALNSLRILIPSNEVVEKFEMTVTSLDDMIHQLSLEIDAFTALRDSLLPKLMNGEIRVPTNP